MQIVTMTAPEALSKNKFNHFIAGAFDAQSSAHVFIFVVSFFFILTPIFYFMTADYDPVFQKLIVMATLSCCTVFVGFKTSVFDTIADRARAGFSLNLKFAVKICMIFFLIFGAIILATADNIPLINAFRGATETELSAQRSGLSKLRGGWEISLVYINSILTTTVVPFVIAHMFLNRTPYRWLFTFLYIIYCQASLEKALFIKGILPILYL
ncbi:MAG: hypothetical protein ACRCUE_16080, partial [Bosea sp. (in: a-proteobacteria)]